MSGLSRIVSQSSPIGGGFRVNALGRDWEGPDVRGMILVKVGVKHVVDLGRGGGSASALSSVTPLRLCCFCTRLARAVVRVATEGAAMKVVVGGAGPATRAVRAEAMGAVRVTEMPERPICLSNPCLANPENGLTSHSSSKHSG